MHVDTSAQPASAELNAPADVRVDSVPTLGADGAGNGHDLIDPAYLERLRPSGDISPKRGRGRPKLGAISPRTGEVVRAVRERQSPTGWLAEVKDCLEKAEGLTDGKLPVKLAQAVAMRSESMTVLDVVAAFEKCENMALKLKAAKFLKDTSKGTIEDIRKQAFAFMNEPTEEGADNGEKTE